MSRKWGARSGRGVFWGWAWAARASSRRRRRFVTRGIRAPLGLLCDAKTQLCFAPSPPAVQLSAPAASEVITGNSVRVAGSVQSDSHGATAEVSLGAGDAWQAVPSTRMDV